MRAPVAASVLSLMIVSAALAQAPAPTLGRTEFVRYLSGKAARPAKP